MKVFFHYEDNDNTELHKSLKITLPKSWKTGPVSQLLSQFVESYNNNETLGSANPLDASQLHIGIRHAEAGGEKSVMRSLASDAIVVESIPDRSDVYILHGPSQTIQEMEAEENEKRAKEQENLKNTVQCTRFGCKNRFPKGGPYPKCRYHKSPPVFHETAKFWSCCPTKRAYDWEDFQNIPGCQTADECTEVKENEGAKQFWGGTDLREQAGEVAKLKSIDDFNKTQAAGGAEAAPVLDRLRSVLNELGIEKELFEQVADGIKKELLATNAGLTDVEILELVKADLGAKIKSNFKAIAAEQLRIK